MQASLDNHEILIKFGKKLQEVRKFNKITQDELADKISVHRTYIGMMERGERNPTITTICKVARALKVKVSDLLAF